MSQTNAAQQPLQVEAAARIIFGAMSNQYVGAWRDAQNAARELLSNALAPAWQDISNAPLDGSPVDLWRDGERLIGFSWNVERKCWQKKVGYPAKTVVLTEPPTHWMPVPPAAV
ncbi:MAG: hypothetical protein DI537_10695 [Stutzerimonas stutzeri]|nr:MAG: hypothetical protein DI537_10695 [Stutzerimonas stutzeri]